MSETPSAGKSRKAPAKAAAEPKTFEEAITRLEDLVAAMEAGTQDLDALVASYEEGRALVEFCGGKLAAIERKVEILAKKADGTVAAEPFSEEF